jgi:YD repeat-containing protein
MKSLFGTLTLLTVMLICLGCAASNISRVEDEWGPPAKIVKNDGTETYFWYFETGYFTKAWAIYEFTCDPKGKIISKRSYLQQPKLETPPQKSSLNANSPELTKSPTATKEVNPEGIAGQDEAWRQRLKQRGLLSE